nr:hypothetical protein [Candidatus Cloacimonadota bacterium]
MKRQNLNAYLSKRHRQLGILKMEILFLLAVTLLLSTQLSAEDWMQLYPEIDGPVADMEFSELPGISEYGLIFALWSSGGGLGYYDDTGQFNVYNSMLYEYMISISADNSNNRIFCAIFSAAIVPNLVKFDVYTHQFEVVAYVIGSWFVKKLPSGFYYGYGNGLLFSETGDVWENIDFFNLKSVRDIEEISDGTLFVAAGNEIYLENDTTFISYDTGLPVNDIYILHHPTEEVYIAIGDGSWSD